MESLVICEMSVLMNLMARGKKLPLRLSVLAIRPLKRVPDCIKLNGQLPGWEESLMMFVALKMYRFG